MNRKNTLALLWTLGLILGLGYLSRTPAGGLRQLTLWAQEECIHPDVLEDFTYQTGIEILWLEAGPEETEIIAGCDLVLGDIELLSQLREEEKLASGLPALAAARETVDPAFLEPSLFQEGGAAIPAFWTTMGMIYAPEQTDIRVMGWSALFSGDFSGRVVMPEGGREGFAIALAALGFEVNTNDLAHISAAEDYLAQQTSQLLGYCSPQELKRYLTDHPALVAPCYGADAIRLMALSPDLSFVLPSEGSWCRVLGYAIPVDSEQQEEAGLLLAHLMEAEPMARNGAYSSWSVVSRDAYELLDSSWQSNPLAYPAGEVRPAAPLLARQSGEIRTLCQTQWQTLMHQWSEHHWER